MNKTIINGVVYESNHSMSIINNKVVCSGDYYVNGKLYREDNIDESANSISKKYDLTDIKSIYNGFFNIVLDIDPSNEKEELIITASEKAHQKMNISFNRSNLLIDSKAGQVGQISITVRAKYLEKIINSAVGDISGRVLTNELYLENQGVGNIRLEGKVIELNIENSGVGNVNTLELLARKVSFDNSGVGNLKCTAQVIKKGKLSGVGNVKYHADEEAKISKSGLGSVKYLGKKSFDTVQKPQKSVESFKSNVDNLNEQTLNPETLKEFNKKLKIVAEPKEEKIKDINTQVEDKPSLSQKFKKIL